MQSHFKDYIINTGLHIMLFRYNIRSRVIVSSKYIFLFSTCDECNLSESLKGLPSASACDNPFSAVHASFICIMEKGGSAFIIARACKDKE